MSTETPEQRIARWAERDAAVGLEAELRQAHLALTERDAELAELRTRNAELANRVTQMSIERDVLRRHLDAIGRPSLLRRVYRKLRRIVGRVLPH